MSGTAAPRRSGKVPPIRVRLDPTRCAGHGICALIAAERIGLDAWGFAVVDPTPVADSALRRRLRRAVAACPGGALTIEDLPERSGTGAALR